MFFTRKKENKLIEGAGGVVVTKSVYNRTANIKWLFREESINPADSGWRVIGDIDTQEYIDNPDNSIVVDFNTLANIEPAVLKIYNMPVGTELEYCHDNIGRYFIDSSTGKRVK